MEDVLVPITKETLLLAVLVSGILQYVKVLPWMTEKLTMLLPLAGVVLGIAGSFLVPHADMNVVLHGVAVGLLASGGYKMLSLPTKASA